MVRSAFSDTLEYLSKHLTCFPVLATDDDSWIAVETFGNYLSLILASEVPFAPFISVPSHKDFFATSKK